MTLGGILDFLTMKMLLATKMLDDGINAWQAHCRWTISFLRMCYDQGACF